MQLDILEHHFQTQSQYPDAVSRERLAAQVNLAEPRVQVRIENSINFRCGELQIISFLLAHFDK